MMAWPQCDRFRELADGVAARGRDKAAQASGIGITLSTFVTHYSGRREPGKKTLKAIATYYGVPLADLTDDPGTEIPGVPLDVVKSLTPAKRMVLRMIAARFQEEVITDSMAEGAWKAIESCLALACQEPNARGAHG